MDECTGRSKRNALLVRFFAILIPSSPPPPIITALVTKNTIIRTTHNSREHEYYFRRPIRTLPRSSGSVQISVGNNAWSVVTRARKDFEPEFPSKICNMDSYICLSHKSVVQDHIVFWTIIVGHAQSINSYPDEFILKFISHHRGRL